MHPYEFLQRFGPTALVTDASSDIGEAFAALLAKGGFDLVLCAPHKAPLETLAARLRDHEGVAVTVLEADLMTPGQFDQLAQACESQDIGLLVSTVEHCLAGVLSASNTASLQATVQQTLTTTVHSDAILPILQDNTCLSKLVARGTGGIILHTNPGSNAEASPAGNTLVEKLWSELQPLGITVLGLCTGSSGQPGQVPGNGSDSGLQEPPTVARATAQAAIDNIELGPLLILA